MTKCAYHFIMNKFAIIIFTSFLFLSCSSFSEVHYFKDRLKPTSNYYKVEIKGHTMLSSSRYVSGYYDRGAVQAYFGELSQPAKGKFIPLEENDERRTGQKELVLLLSTNSDAIASSIGNLVKSKSVVNSLTLIVNKDKIAEANAVKSQLNKLNTDIDLLIAKADTYLDIDINSTSFAGVQVKERLKQFLKMELFELFNDAEPDSFNELYDWYLKNNQN